MSELEDQKKEVGLEQLVRQFMKNQLTNVTDFTKGEDNSFAFLEKSTLQLLLASLLTGNKREPEKHADGQVELSVVKELENLIEDNKVQFEEIIDYLKELS